jgi:NAD(P)-dependent dehydrogenase (short-subunit alcohol dehydrogenase family)
LEKRVAVVTGASGGIGLLSALELARSGFHVVATMRNLSKRTGLDRQAADQGLQPNIEVRHFDVTDFPSIRPAIESIANDLGRIDVLVNNAGFAMGGFAEDVTLAELREQLETNFFGHVEVTKAAMPVFRRQRAGHVIMVSSISGVCAQAGVSSYSASKFALEGWSESLRIESQPLGIQVVLVEPGAFKTDVWDTNVRVAEAAFSGQSPNKVRARYFAEYVKNKVVKHDPIQVARLIARIANDPSPRLRYVVGADAYIQKWMKLVLPWKWYERILARELGLDKE